MGVLKIGCYLISCVTTFSAYTHSWFALGTRCYLVDVFLRSGWSKLAPLGSGTLLHESTLFLFEQEYQVPLLSPYLAAVIGTLSEVGFSVLLLIGLAGRLPALGLFGVNLVAALSYPFLWTTPGLAGLYDHVVWGLLIGFLIAHGSGKASIDYLLTWKCDAYRY